MIHIIRGTSSWMEPILTATMHSDRKRQFRDRLGWPVQIDQKGYERDEYDDENPLYVIVSTADGRHAGSLRLLPTTGKTMLNDHFSGTVGDKEIRDPRVWECTRFCLSPQQDPKVALALLVTTARLMQLARLKSLVAIFDEKMLRLYRRMGIEPEVLGSKAYDTGIAQAGLWHFDDAKYRALFQASQVDPLELELVTANTRLPWDTCVIAT